MFKKLRKYFLTGLAVLLPIILTVLLLRYLLQAADVWLVNPLYKALPFDVDKNLAVLLIKSLIIVIVLGFICLVGVGTEIFIVKNFFKFMEGLVQHVPMVNRVYGTIKEIMSAFMGKDRELFRSAVLIEYPRPGLYSIAFITRTSHAALSKKVNKNLVSVFLPTTPNPTSGLLLFLPREEVIPLTFTVEEAIKLVVSGGAVTRRTMEG